MFDLTTLMLAYEQECRDQDRSQKTKQGTWGTRCRRLYCQRSDEVGPRILLPTRRPPENWTPGTVCFILREQLIKPISFLYSSQLLKTYLNHSATYLFASSRPTLSHLARGFTVR